jgi:TRAP-type C4-dicarboxylate transport system substrate-binding protein
MEIHELFARALHNQDFWNKLKKDPARAFKEAGIDATPQQIEAVKQLNYAALERIATVFGGGSIT